MIHIRQIGITSSLLHRCTTGAGASTLYGATDLTFIRWNFIVAISNFNRRSTGFNGHGNSPRATDNHLVLFLSQGMAWAGILKRLHSRRWHFKRAEAELLSGFSPEEHPLNRSQVSLTVCSLSEPTYVSKNPVSIPRRDSTKSKPIFNCWLRRRNC